MRFLLFLVFIGVTSFVYLQETHLVRVLMDGQCKSNHTLWPINSNKCYILDDGSLSMKITLNQSVVSRCYYNNTFVKGCYDVNLMPKSCEIKTLGQCYKLPKTPFGVMWLINDRQEESDIKTQINID
jgi:hypothetical protein